MAMASAALPNSCFPSCSTSTGQPICPGDFVYLLPNDPNVEFFVAKIENIYHDDNSQICVYVRWFYRSKDLHHNPPSPPSHNEVYHTDYHDCQLVKSVVGRCKVVRKTATHHLSLKLGRSGERTHPEVHVCEYSYSEETGLFTAVQDLPLLENNDEAGEVCHEDAAVARELAHILLDIERRIPSEVANANWPAKRLMWVLKARNAMSLNDVKQTLLELEHGLEIFKDQSGWRKTINGIASFDLLVKFIKYFKNSAHQKVNSLLLHQKVPNAAQRSPADESAKKRRPNFQLEPANCSKRRGWHDDRIEDQKLTSSEDLPVALPSTPKISNKQSHPGKLAASSILSGSAYEINRTHLPSHAPTHLTCIRAVLVVEATDEWVTIKFPSITSLTKYFGASSDLNSVATVSHEQDITRCLFGHSKTVIGTKPILDDQFVMSRQLAEKVLKRFISRAEYFQQGHLEAFWLHSNLHVEREGTQLKLEKSRLDKCWGTDKDGISDTLGPGISSPRSQDTLKETEDPVKNSLTVVNVYTHKKFHRSRAPESFRENGKESWKPNYPFVNPAHDSNLNEQNGDKAALVNHERSQNLLDINRGGVLTGEQNQTSLSHQRSEGNYGMVRWGRRKKVTSQYRWRGSSANGCDSGNKEYTSEEEVHSQGKGRILTLRLSSSGHSSEPIMDGEKQMILHRISTATSKEKIMSILKVPKDMQGRWSSERYKAAQLKLLDIMHEKGAVPGNPILRPALREEARKHIGDTGLLDHLLKHMTDTVVSNGERFRRRHNSEGAMEYWLEDASLMEIRKQAGVEDPCWIPPPGWKPGDAIPKNSFYGFVTGMSSSQAEEMEQLKEDVSKLKGQMHSLSVRMKTSLVEMKSNSIPHSNALGSWEKFDEDIRNQTQEMKNELSDLREALETYQTSSRSSYGDKSSGSETTEDRQDSSKESERRVKTQITSPAKIARCGIQDRLKRIDNDIRKLAEEATSRYRSLSTEKKSIEAQLHEIWKTVAIMQEDVSFVLNSMGVPQDIIPLPLQLPSSNHIALEEPSFTPNSIPVATQHCPQGSADSLNIVDDLLLFQKAAIPSSQSFGNCETIGTSSSRLAANKGKKLCLFGANKLSLAEEHGGFRVYKPLMWPGVARSSCLVGAEVSGEQVQGVLVGSSYQASGTEVCEKSAAVACVDDETGGRNNSTIPESIMVAQSDCKVATDNKGHDHKENWTVCRTPDQSQQRLEGSSSPQHISETMQRSGGFCTPVATQEGENQGAASSPTTNCSIPRIPQHPERSVAGRSMPTHDQQQGDINVECHDTSPQTNVSSPCVTTNALQEEPSPCSMQNGSWLMRAPDNVIDSSVENGLSSGAQNCIINKGCGGASEPVYHYTAGGEALVIGTTSNNWLVQSMPDEAVHEAHATKLSNSGSSMTQMRLQGEENVCATVVLKGLHEQSLQANFKLEEPQGEGKQDALSNIVAVVSVPGHIESPPLNACGGSEAATTHLSSLICSWLHGNGTA